MLSTWETTGQWWPAGNPAEISSGTLTYSPGIGTKLSNVVGPLAITHPDPGPGPQLIHGRATNGNYFTLVGLYCFQTHSFIPSANFDVDLVLQGPLFATIDQIRFARFESEYSNLHYWLGNRGSISVRHDPRPAGVPPTQDVQTVSIAYPALWDVTFQGARIRYFNGCSAHNDFENGSVEFATREGLKIEFPDPVALSEFYRLERAVRGFIDVLYHAQIQRSKINAGRYGEVEIFHRSRMGRNARQDSERIPVEFAQIQTDINALLDRWLAMHAALEPCLNLFFLGLHDRDINIENVFLGIMQAVEAFHRTFFPGTFVAQNDYDTTVLPPIRDAIPQGLDPSFRQSLTSRLRYGNEKSLRARLRDLIQSLPSTTTFQAYRDPNLIGRSVVTRNNFTHVITDDADAVYGPVELYHAVQYWQEIMSALIMQRLQLPETVVESAIQAIQASRGSFHSY